MLTTSSLPASSSSSMASLSCPSRCDPAYVHGPQRNARMALLNTCNVMRLQETMLAVHARSQHEIHSCQH